MLLIYSLKKGASQCRKHLSRLMLCGIIVIFDREGEKQQNERFVLIDETKPSWLR